MILFCLLRCAQLKLYSTVIEQLSDLMIMKKMSGSHSAINVNGPLGTLMTNLSCISLLQFMAARIFPFLSSVVPHSLEHVRDATSR